MAFARDTNKHPASADLLPSANSFILNRED